MRTALVTGAGSGLGLELARSLHKRGYRLLLCSRRPASELDPQLRGHAWLSCDLSQARVSAGQLAEACRRLGWDRLNLLILNAAQGFYGPTAAQPAGDLEAMLYTNLLSPILTCRALSPWLTGGRVLFISSVMAHLPCRHYAAYGASKAGLEAFARNLACEWAGRVAVEVVPCPAMRTGMHQRAGVPEELLRGQRLRDPAEIAEQILERRQGAVLGPVGRVLRLVSRWAPGRAVRPRTPRIGGPGRALLTGAAGGIGAALAHQLEAAGWQVRGLDRKGAQVNLDLAVWDAEQARSALDGMDTLIHNAGLSCVGRLERSPQAGLERLVRVNLLAPLQWTALALGRRPAPGRLVLVSSLSHYLGYPGAAVYAATKTALVTYALSLEAELEATRVTLVFPGPTRTEMARRYSPRPDLEASRMDPDQVARAILQGLTRGRRRVVPGWRNLALAWAAHLAPGPATGLLARGLAPLLELPEAIC